MVKITKILRPVGFSDASKQAVAEALVIAGCSIHFAEDLHGHDARLDRALAAGGQTHPRLGDH
jgi:hypothetical protein